jgi:hypothetical protein
VGNQINLYLIQRFWIYRKDIVQIFEKFRVIDGSYLGFFLALLIKKVKSDFVIQTIDGCFKISKGDGYDQIYTLNPFVEFQLNKYLSESKADLFIDVGSFMGAHTISYARLHPNSKIYAIEAAPLNYQKLLANVQLNGCKNVTCLNFAASSLSSIVKFPNLVSSKLSSRENYEGTDIQV